MNDKKDCNSISKRSESIKKGKGLRSRVPRRCHSSFYPTFDRPDPISILQKQDEGRIQKLLPIKYGRMLESPFAFLRGSAAVMAQDLAVSPATGIQTILCGDAHLSNFGIFATPERKLVFDINDFDETYLGPWEWDLKRLAASAVVAAREKGFDEKVCRELALTLAKVYRDAMRHFAKLQTLDIWYFNVDVGDVQKAFRRTSKKAGKSSKELVEKARTRTQRHTINKLTHFENGKRLINHEPPLLVPLRDMGLEKVMGEEELRIITDQSVKDAWTQYMESLPLERRYLLKHYRIIDAALRVGGVGSIGTRCTIVLLEGGSQNDNLILQLKEAGESVLETHLGKGSYTSHGQRIVVGQRLMQAASDIFLGWHTSKFTNLDYYWRQLKDMKGSADISAMDKESLHTYLSVCSLCLARAHARTADNAGISGYLGKNDSFPKAIGDFAVAYADQTERDYNLLVKAVKSGRLPAETGV
ncbi:MAG: DUF2252 domain-containing protein [Anaerolineales bacterium]